MKTSLITLTAVALAATVVGQAAIAAENSGIGNIETVTVAEASPADVQVVTNWQTTEDHDAQLAILRSALNGNAKRANNLMVAGAAFTNRDVLLRDILTVLNENAEANAKVISELLEQYGNLLAAAAGDIEPAGGDEGTDVNFGGDQGGEGGENPSQLNTPTDTNPAASAVTP